MAKFIVTLTLQWGHTRDPSYDGGTVLGWAIRINGLRASHRDRFRNDTMGHSMVEIDNGKTIDLLICPRQQPAFSPQHGAKASNPPFNYVTDYLDSLGSVGYEVGGSHTFECQGKQPTSIWTLQMSRT